MIWQLALLGVAEAVVILLRCKSAVEELFDSGGVE